MSLIFSPKSILLQCFGCKHCRGTVNKNLIFIGIGENKAHVPLYGVSHKPTFQIKQSLKEINKKNVIVYYSVSEDPVIKGTVIRNNSLLTTASAHSRGGEGKRGEGNGERFCHRRQSRMSAGK